MKVAFFNCLLLEYGGGTARFFIEAAAGLKKKYCDLDVSIVTLDESLGKKISRIYSLYFQRNIQNELALAKSDLRPVLKKKGVRYVTVGSFSALKRELGGFDSVYSKNDIVEAVILKFLVGYKNLRSVIFGFHTPVCYELNSSWQSRLHNLMYGSFFYRYLIDDAKKFHVLNEFDEKLLKYYFKNKEIKRIYNPFDFRQSKNSRIILKRDKKDSLNVLWVGRLTKEKGADDLICLINETNNTGKVKKIRWTVAGRGQYEGKIRILTKKYNNINYSGYRDHSVLLKFYGQSDLFISTSKWESFPYTFLEAQSFGLPIIS